MKEDKSEKKPAAYPQPTEKDKQLNNNPEFIDQQPNDFHDKSISDIPPREDQPRKPESD
jgi:hypothetical protein